MRFGVCVVLSLSLVGCGGRKYYNTTPDAPGRTANVSAEGASSPTASMEQFMARARAAMANAHPAAPAVTMQAERSDPALATALLVATATPSPANLRAVAREYVRLSITDRAIDYLERALALDPRDAAAYDAKARIWRDGGVLERALADAHRAVYYAPGSAAAHNTLGTVFQALGRRAEAREQYSRAVALDPMAAYALNNLCYAWILEGRLKDAEASCQQALSLSPSMHAARNNLGLAYAAGGKMDSARAAFDGIGDRATAAYNLGIAQMAGRRYSDAVTAFAAAQQARPSWRIAGVRAEQAERLAKAGAEE